MFSDKSFSNHSYILRNHKLRSPGQRAPKGMLMVPSQCSEDSAKFVMQAPGSLALVAPCSWLSSSYISAILTSLPRSFYAWKEA